MKLLKLEQRTPEWHAWRNGEDLDGIPRITASMLPVIMGTSPWQTSHDLWLELTGRKPPKAQTFAMSEGVRKEPIAREILINQYGEDFIDACIEHDSIPWAAASLDGINLFGDLIAEIKAPGALTHAKAQAGQAPDYYLDQMQWQLFCSGAAKCIYASFIGETVNDTDQFVDLPVLPDPIRQQELYQAAEAFRECLINDVPPAGEEFIQAALMHRKLFLQAAEMKLMLEDSEKRLKGMLEATKKLQLEGGGVKISKFEAKGSIDNEAYLKFLESKHNLKFDPSEKEKFRGAGSWRFKITVSEKEPLPQPQVVQSVPMPAIPQIGDPAVANQAAALSF